MKSEFLTLFVLCTLMSAQGTANPLHNAEEQFTNIGTPININGNNEFYSTATAKNWPGNGSESNPFILEGITISTNGLGVSAVLIQNTDISFVVRGGEFLSVNGTAIYLQNVTNAAIEDIVFQNSKNELEMYDSTNIMVSNIEIKSSVFAVRSQNIVFSEIKNSGPKSLFIESSTNISVSTYTNEGSKITSIVGREVNGLNLTNIEIRDSETGINLYKPNNTRIENVLVENMTFGITATYGYDVTINNVTGYDIWQFIEFTEMNNSTITNNSFYNRITNSNGGIWVLGGKNILVSKNRIENTASGIRSHAAGNVIVDNYAFNTGLGYRISGGIIMNNTVDSNITEIASAGFDIDSSVVSGNTARYNSITLRDNNTVTNNSVFGGFLIVKGVGNTITENDFLYYVTTNYEHVRETYTESSDNYYKSNFYATANHSDMDGDGFDDTSARIVIIGTSGFIEDKTPRSTPYGKYLPSPIYTFQIVINYTSFDNSVSFSWEEPYTDGGSPILEYQIYMSNDSSGQFKKIGVSTTTEFTITNIMYGNLYTVYIQAVNSVGMSPPTLFTFRKYQQTSTPTTSQSTTTSSINTSEATNNRTPYPILTLLAALPIRRRAVKKISRPVHKK